MTYTEQIVSGRKWRKHDLIKKINTKIFIAKLCAGIPTIHNMSRHRHIHGYIGMDIDIAILYI